MRILHINLICGHGGIETLLATLVKEQRKMGLEADVYSFVDRGGGGAYDGICNAWFAGKDSLAEVLLRGRYDVVHAVTYAATSAAISLRKAWYRGAVVVTSHGVGAYEEALQSDAVVAVSESVAKSIQEHYSQPVQVIYNGVDTELFYPPRERSDEKPILAWVGRGSDPHKDVGGLFAMANSRRFPDFQFVLVDGSTEDAQPANWLPPGGEIHRRKRWQEMPDLYRRVASSGGFLMSTSRVDASPMAILEAQACGCPVIAPAVGGIPEIVDHQSTGYLYERQGGVAAVAEAVEWLYAGDNYARASTACVEHVKRGFSAQRMCSEYMLIYQKALGTRKRSVVNSMVRFGLSLAVASARCFRGKEKSSARKQSL